jgi:tetratricopeptide (TPR) repeat protein
MLRSSSLALVSTVLAAVLGCHEPGAARPPRAQSQPPDALVEPAAPGETSASPDLAAPPVGWARIPAARDPAGERLVRQGHAHHRAGRHEAALASFEQALVVAPDDPTIRHGRAAALARLGRTRQAVAEMERLVLEDLPTFGPRWSTSDDFAQARATAEGQQLEASLPMIRAAYSKVIAAGIPAMTYRARPPLDANGQPQIPHEDLRLGVYDPVGRRFVPVTPAVPGALGGYLDRQAERALVLAGDLVMGDIWLVQARNLDVAIFDLADPGRAVLLANDVDAHHPETDQIRVAVEAALEGDDARLTLEQLGYDPAGTRSLRVTVDGIRLTREPVSPTSPRVHVDASGAFIEVPPPAGVWLDAEGLHAHDRRAPVALAPGHEREGLGAHQHVARTPDRRFGLVLTEIAGCHEVAYMRHVLDHVDLIRGRATRLSTAPTHAGVALGPDGSVYLDVDGRVVRFPPGSTTPVADVLPGVRFALPHYDRDCSV